MLKLCDISMYYQNGNNVTVGIQGINLELNKGEFVVITGESGSGKSTLLNVISSLAPYHDGEMYFNGEATSGYDDTDWENYRRDHIGFIFQNYSLIESYTALQNVVSAMLIMGVPPAEAKKRARSCLELVGLGELAGRRASKLSAGQKQRLTIARALAKETDMIIADEPTGNLDSKNGRLIVELLASLAKDRLVVMVSHNIEEAEEFATRMIRMKDGRIVSDSRRTELNAKADNAITENAAGMKAEAEKQNAKADKRAAKGREKAEKSNDTAASVKRLSGLSLSRRLAGCNSKFQPAKAVVITLLMAAVCIAAFVFIGSMLSNLDDTPAKIYNSSAFLNGDNTRILVQHKSGEKFTDEELDFFRTLPNVTHVDRYGYAGDCCYYYEEDYDYEVKVFVPLPQSPDEKEKRILTPVMLRNINFIKSAEGLSEDMLAAGRLPENSNELVMYSDDASKLGSTMTVYFSDPKNWSKGSSVGLEMTVVGLLKEETRQIYFDDSISAAFYLSRILNSNNMLTTYYSSYSEFFPAGKFKRKEYDAAGRPHYDDYSTVITELVSFKDSMRIFPDASIDDDTVFSTVSESRINNSLMNSQCEGHYATDDESFGAEKVYGILDSNRQYIGQYGMTISFKGETSSTMMVYHQRMEYSELTGKATLYVEPEFKEDYDRTLFKNVEFSNEEDKRRAVGTDINIINDKRFEDLLDFYDVGSDQAAIYVSNYAYANDVMSRITGTGEYLAVSPFAISSTNYDSTKVRERFAALMLSLVALIAVFLLEILVLFTIMRLKRDDYAVFKSLGMTNKLIKQMNYIELMKYDVIALALAAAAVGILWYYNVSPLNDFTIYYRWQHVLVVILCSIASTLLLGMIFNRYLNKQFAGKRITGENGR